MLTVPMNNQFPRRAQHGRARSRAMLAGLLLAGAGPAASAQFAPPESPLPYTVTVTNAAVSFPLGSIPGSVPRSALGTPGPDGGSANLTGGLGPITSETYSTSAPAGIQFRLDGEILGSVSAGTPLQYLWEVVVEFNGGVVNWSVAGNDSVPGAGLHNVGSNGQLQPGVRTISYVANRTFAGNSTGAGFYGLQLNLNWSAIAAGQSMTITVNRMQIALPAAGPTALAVVSAGVLGVRRRRT